MRSSPLISGNNAVRFLVCALFATAGSPGFTAPPQDFRFEVFSIRPEYAPSGMVTNTGPTPGGFASRLTLWQAIMIAWGPTGDPASWSSVQLRQAPDWVYDYYQIQARVAPADLKAWQSQSSAHELLRSAMQAALTVRCGIRVHEEPEKSDNFELVTGRGEPRLKRTDKNFVPPMNGKRLEDGGYIETTAIRRYTAKIFYNVTMQDLADFLTGVSKKIPVRDKTNLTGRYDFTLLQIPTDPREDRVFNYPIGKLGLRLRMATEARPILVIDHIGKPTQN